jgi:hypothetical protein
MSKFIKYIQTPAPRAATGLTGIGAFVLSEQPSWPGALGVLTMVGGAYALPFALWQDWHAPRRAAGAAGSRHLGRDAAAGEAGHRAHGADQPTPRAAGLDDRRHAAALPGGRAPAPTAADPGAPCRTRVAPGRPDQRQRAGARLQRTAPGDFGVCDRAVHATHRVYHALERAAPEGTAIALALDGDRAPGAWCALDCAVTRGAEPPASLSL